MRSVCALTTLPSPRAHRNPCLILLSLPQRSASSFDHWNVPLQTLVLTRRHSGEESAERLTNSSVQRSALTSPTATGGVIECVDVARLTRIAPGASEMDEEFGRNARARALRQSLAQLEEEEGSALNGGDEAEEAWQAAALHIMAIEDARGAAIERTAATETSDVAVAVAAAVAAAAAAKNAVPFVVRMSVLALIPIIESASQSDSALKPRIFQIYVELLQGLPLLALRDEPCECLDALRSMLEKHLDLLLADATRADGDGGENRAENALLLDRVLTALLGLALNRGNAPHLIALALKLIQIPDSASASLRVAPFLRRLQEYRAEEDVVLPSAASWVAAFEHHPVSTRQVLVHAAKSGYRRAARGGAVEAEDDAAAAHALGLEHAPEAGAVATDGAYLYLHSRLGVVKVGSGRGESLAGYVYAHAPGLLAGEVGVSLACCGGRLLAHAPRMLAAGTLAIELDPQTLGKMREIALPAALRRGEPTHQGAAQAGTESTVPGGWCIFMYRSNSCESCSQFDSLPLTSFDGIARRRATRYARQHEHLARERRQPLQFPSSRDDGAPVLRSGSQYGRIVVCRGRVPERRLSMRQVWGEQERGGGKRPRALVLPPVQRGLLLRVPSEERNSREGHHYPYT